MTTRFLAHRRETDNGEQTVLEHLTGTAKLAQAFAAEFGAGDEGYFCGVLHDVGKYSAAFQRRIRGSSEQTDHATAGAQEAHKRENIPAAFCIAGHHGGLPNFGAPNAEGSENSTLFGRLKKEVEPYGGFADEVILPEPSFSVGGNPFADSVYIRMLFSSLVDADFLDTENFMRSGGQVRGDYLPPAALLARLEAYIAPWFPPTTALNQMRCNVLTACRAGAKLPPGLFRLTVPTGGGKTVSSAEFALHHAVEHGKKRVIYVIPYCSIIEQTVKTFSDIFGADQVVAHYSTADLNEEARKDGKEDAVKLQELRRRLATENWDAPIIVTTAVQFFESLYANKPSRCRKLHNIAQSVVIFDEAQMLPVPYLRPCIAVMGELTRRYGVSAVLCTATQPALGSLLDELMPGAAVPELCPNVAELFSQFSRVRYADLGTLSLLDMTQRLLLHRQVLCIVNRRKDAQEIFAGLPKDGSFCLTTLMTPLHRQETLDSIRTRLLADLPCRVVSTSLIEAGVDVDFPTVYRAECGLDSLVQAAGRCNRENKRPVEESVVYTFRTEQGAPKMFAQNIAAAQQALETGAPPDAPETQTAYFKALFQMKGSAALDLHKILPALAGKSGDGPLPFRSVAEEFKLIETAAVTLYVPTGMGAELVTRLEREGVSRELLRQLGGYGVTCYPGHLKQLLDAGSAAEVANSLFVLRDLALYDEKIGLAPNVEEGQGFIV